MRSQRSAVLRIVALAALPLVLVSLIVIWQNGAEREQQVARAQLGLTRAAARITDSLLDSHLATLASLAVSPDLQAARVAPERTSALLKRFADANPDWAGLSVIGPDGSTLAASRPVPPGLSLAYRDYFQQALTADSPTVSNLIVGRVSGSPSIILAAPIEIEAVGRGTLIVPIPTASLQQALAETLGPQSDDILLFDRERNPVIQPSGGPDAPRALALADPVRRGEAESQTVQLDGQELLVTYAPLPDYGWGALTARPTSVIFADARRDLLARLALLGLGLATMAGLGWYFGGHLARLYRAEVESRARAEAARAEAEAAHHRVRWLADASEQLGSSLDYEQTLASVARSVVPTFADWCFVDLLEPNGRVRRVAVEYANPGWAALAEGFRAYPPDPNAAVGAGRVLRTGEPELVSEAPGVPLVSAIYDEHHRALVAEMQPRSVLRVAMRARERTLGVLSFVQTQSSRQYGPVELTLAQELARRAALAIDNARLYREAQQAIQARDEFLSIASHELRTPLTTLLATVQILLRADARGQLDSRQLRRLLQRMEQSSDRLAALISDLLDVSRLESGRLPLRLERLDLLRLTEAVLGRIAAQLDERHRLVVDLPASPCPVLADPGRIEQVLTNLVENAAKYSPDGGEIRVSAGLEGAQARLEVRDQGIGLPPGAEAVLFEPFGRAANVTGQNLPGLGLGLYICRQIVEQHGGQIRLDSAGPGLGTTVRVWLPLSKSLVGSPTATC